MKKISIFFLVILIFLLYLKIIGSFISQDNFCKSEGFERANGEYRCVDRYRISDKRVGCEGIIKVECYWKEELKVVKVGK